MDVKKRIGLVLRDLRKSSGDIDLTQADVAEFSGLSLRYYNYLENGQKMPTVDTLMKIASTYKMKLSEICKLIEEY